MFVTGVVLAAGSSRRLGQPKQLLPFRGGTLLGATLGMARSCGFGQLLVMLGGHADRVRAGTGFTAEDTVVEVPGHGEGCGASVSTAADLADERADGLVLLLGDQPGVRPDDVRALLAAAAGSPAGLCRYRGSPGHPLWFRRDTFGDLSALHGDKAVWKLLHDGRLAVAEHPVDRPVPADVDTWADYEALLAGARSGAGTQG